MISYIETHIEDACNLRCRGCSHFSGLAKPKHKDLDDFRREFERLSQIEDIKTIRLMGGEPLLNPDFIKYCRIAREFYPGSNIYLVTNGILLDRLFPYIDELRSLRVCITVSDYHIDAQKLQGFDVLPYRDKHEKGMLYNISLDLTGSQDKTEAFNKCDIHRNHWNFLKDGRLYPCCIAGTIQDFWQHFDLDWGLDQKSFGIDIYKASAVEIEAFLERPFELCRFCDTGIRLQTYKRFEKSKGDIREWTT